MILMVGTTTSETPSANQKQVYQQHQQQQQH